MAPSGPGQLDADWALNAMEQYIPYIIVVGAFAGWCALWIAGNWVVARLCGWAELARHYKQVRAFNGHRFLFQSGVLQYPLLAFRGTLIVGANAEGLQLQVLPPFAFGHARLFIPWQEIRYLPEHEGTMRLQPELEFASCPAVRLVVSRRLGQRLVESSQGAFTFEGAI